MEYKPLLSFRIPKIHAFYAHSVHMWMLFFTENACAQYEDQHGQWRRNTQSEQSFGGASHWSQTMRAPPPPPQRQQMKTKTFVSAERSGATEHGYCYLTYDLLTAPSLDWLRSGQHLPPLEATVVDPPYPLVHVGSHPCVLDEPVSQIPPCSLSLKKIRQHMRPISNLLLQEFSKSLISQAYNQSKANCHSLTQVTTKWSMQIYELAKDNWRRMFQLFNSKK